MVNKFLLSIAIPFASFGMGWLAYGFHQLDVGIGFGMALASLVLFMWLAWEQID